MPPEILLLIVDHWETSEFVGPSKVETKGLFSYWKCVSQAATPRGKIEGIHTWK